MRCPVCKGDGKVVLELMNGMLEVGCLYCKTSGRVAFRDWFWYVANKLLGPPR